PARRRFRDSGFLRPAARGSIGPLREARGPPRAGGSAFGRQRATLQGPDSDPPGLLLRRRIVIAGPACGFSVPDCALLGKASPGDFPLPLPFGGVEKARERLPGRLLRRRRN